MTRATPVLEVHETPNLWPAVSEIVTADHNFAAVGSKLRNLWRAVSEIVTADHNFAAAAAVAA